MVNSIHAEFKGALWHDVIHDDRDSIADVVTPYSPELECFGRFGHDGDPEKEVNLIVMFLCEGHVYRLDLSIISIVEALNIVGCMEASKYAAVDFEDGQAKAIACGSMRHAVADSRQLCPLTWAGSR